MHIVTVSGISRGGRKTTEMTGSCTIMSYVNLGVVVNSGVIIVTPGVIVTGVLTLMI